MSETRRFLPYTRWPEALAKQYRAKGLNKDDVDVVAFRQERGSPHCPRRPGRSACNARCKKGESGWFWQSSTGRRIGGR